MRLIDADAVIAEQYDILKKLYGGTEQTLKEHLDIDDALAVPIHAMEMYSRAKQFYFGLKGIVENAPTVDSVPVVRCRDCKHVKNAKVNKKGYRICPVSHMEIVNDDFCSYGDLEVSNENSV